MPTPIDQRKKPKDVKIHVKSGAGVDITWADGHASHFDFPSCGKIVRARPATTSVAKKKWRLNFR